MGSGVQFFPQVVAPSTFLGRLASGAGPVEAIPFSSLAAAISGTPGALTVTTLTATTSVVTPLINSGGAFNLNLQFNGSTQLVVSGGSVFPGADNVQVLGLNTFRWATVYTPIIDSGTTGSLSLKTNNGTIGVQLIDATTPTTNLGFQAGNGNANIYAQGATNSGLFLVTKGTGSLNLLTGSVNDSGGSSITQFQVLHTASSTRNITVTGSNGGNPTIGVTGGSLAITPSVVIAGARLAIGTNPASGNGLAIPYGSSSPINSRDSANSIDLLALQYQTINSIVNVLMLGDTSASTGGTIISARIVAGAPSVNDIPAGRWALWRDTSGATTKLYYNNGGTLQSVALA